MLIHNLAPIAFHIGAVPIRWYALAYVAGLLVGLSYFKFLNKKFKLKLSATCLDDLFCWAIPCIIVGGRLGYVLVYDLAHVLKHPLDIFKTWQGGMSFHGGMVGFIVAAAIVARRNHANPWTLLDLSACIVPAGIFLGRLANLMNGELFGRLTDVPWAVVFSNTGGGNTPRHPSQLYEAMTEGLLLLVIMNGLLLFTKARLRPGLLTGVAAILYSIFRFGSEFFREPDYQLGYFFSYLTAGQILSAAMLVAGCLIVLRQKHNQA